MKFPRTLREWIRLFWLTVHCCPVHKSFLHSDPWAWGDDSTLYCFKCEGIAMWPGGFFYALAANKKADCPPPQKPEEGGAR